MVNTHLRTAMRRTTGMAIALAMGCSGALLALPSTANAAPADTGSTALPAATDVQVIAFQQTWNSIARECTSTYGPEGVKYVEVSPPQESIQGTQWWTSYQPVSYKLDSKLGTEAEFKNMVTTCSAAGVGIIADVVLNQTTGSDVADSWQTGTADTKYNGETGDYPGFTGESDQYPQGVTKADFHDYENGKSISDYTNQTEVQEGRLSSMWDFNTSEAKVQDIQSDYLVKLWDMGVRAFRMDAIKHINKDDVKGIKDAMVKKLNAKGQSVTSDDIYWIQEVIGNSSEAAGIQPYNYFGTGTVTQFDYKSDLNAKFKGNIAGLKDLSTRIGDTSSNKLAVPSDKANVFVTNWDTERSDGAITYKDGSMYSLANAFMLSYDYGTPRLLSDYQFDNSDDGAPGATATSVPDVDFDTACATKASKSGDWNCEQRWTTTRGMIAFHNYVSGTTVGDWQDDGANNIAFSRGDKGFVAINNSSEDKTAEYTTSMPDGEYCNVYVVGDCSQTVTVSGGKAKVTVPAMDAVAIYAGATKTTHPTAAAAVDPSTPDVVVPDSTVKPDDTTLTVYYKNDGWDKAYIHYGIGGDWSSPDVEMKKDAQGYYTATVDTQGKKFEMVFTDGGSNWDNPSGGGNYTPATGVTQVGVSDHRMTVGNPEAIGAQTRLVVHYKAAADDPGRGVYFWGTDKNGNDLAGVNHDFTGTDCYGKVGEYTIDGSFDKLGVIITTKDWNKYGQNDRTATVAKDGTAEIWVDGTSSDPEQTLTSAPAGYACKADKVELTIHYMRTDGLYYNAADTATKVPQWDIWTWNSNTNGFAAKFTTHDDWGEIAKASFANYTYQASDGVSDFGMLRRYGADQWAKKDGGDGDIKMTASALVFDAADKTAKGEIWMVQDDATVYTARPALGASIVSAEIAATNTVSAKLSKNADESTVKSEAKLTDAKGDTVAITDAKVDGNTVTLTTGKELDVTAKYTLEIGDFGSADVVAGAVVRTDAFDKEYAYDGDDLGATYGEDGSTFKVWVPTAQDVKLVTYQDDSEDAKEAGTVAMERGDKGVWSVTTKVADGTAYCYRLTFADGTVNTTADPYAKAAVVNGKRSVVLSKSKTDVAGSKRMAPFSSAADAVIAETHIRDFTKSATSGVDADKRGKYLGMVETGTTNKAGKATGIDYLKQLGITHVQIQPMFDYASVDETKALDDSNYNWGYDPENYNVPEGSYSSDASNPSTRIVEAKEMIDGLHDNGIRVVMDVVYNHVADASTNPFNQTVPGYYFRYQNGSLVNNSGCGNDTASERAMMRKYIVDSVTYWAKEYKVDGFRFDLMGLHDLETMKEVRAALDKIDPSILIVGEGWDMNTTMDKSEMAIQPNGYELNTAKSTVSFFNDSIRDGLKGSVFSDTDQGFVNGKTGLEQRIVNNMLGCQNNLDATVKGADGKETLNPASCNNGNALVKYAQASQSVNYVEIHDNLTLNDKLEKSLFVDSNGKALTTDMTDEQKKAEIVEAAKLADTSVFLANGIAEFQLGQEFLRTKGGNGNSYNAGDTVNALDWDRQDDADYGSSVQYVRQLIALRKATAAFRASDYKTIDANAKVIQAKDGVVAYRTADKDGTYVVVLNANGKAIDLSGVDPQTYEVLLDSSASTTQAAANTGVALLGDTATVRAAVDTTGAKVSAATDTTDAKRTVTVAKGGTLKVPARTAMVLGIKSASASGDTGNTGAKGDKGDTGAAGANGTNGANGAAGAKGDTGATGAAGANGANGAAGSVATVNRVASTGSSIAMVVVAAAVLVLGAVVLLVARRERDRD
ncbi:MAG: type I pullulanase [Bifidobacterium sp.]|nr:type I pullulanase [Bifidobacterium sp.]